MFFVALSEMMNIFMSLLWLFGEEIVLISDLPGLSKESFAFRGETCSLVSYEFVLIWPFPLWVVVPGGSDGPSGVLICSENYITYKNFGDQPDIRCPIPRRRVSLCCLPVCGFSVWAQSTKHHLEKSKPLLVLKWWAFHVSSLTI